MVIDNDMNYGFTFEDETSKKEFKQLVHQVKGTAKHPIICFVDYDQLGERSKTVIADRLIINMFVDDEDFNALTDISMEHLAGRVIMSINLIECMSGDEGGVRFDI